MTDAAELPPGTTCPTCGGPVASMRHRLVSGGPPATYRLEGEVWGSGEDMLLTQYPNDTFDGVTLAPCGHRAAHVLMELSAPDRDGHRHPKVTFTLDPVVP